ncbi:MAG: hypothetical protein KAR17_07220 [Cyclobacteriaceae bacterium]|nr:hypothetical protein [Cyclobacteriaceae bacterium]MCK5278706.1 hypothetical protein [Cyclobacteriaceae bacterium]
MTDIDQIRSSIIDKLLTINNPELLSAYNKILDSTSKDKITLNKSQKEMLEMSEEDILAERVISQSEIDNEDAKWLN